MSTLASDAELSEIDLDRLPVDDERGTLAMKLFITTEAALFVCLFFGYFYVGHGRPPWPLHPPKVGTPLVMLGVLLSSSGVLYLGELAARKGWTGLGRIAVAATMSLGILFICLQGSEYHRKWSELRPTTDAYGSLFYAITGFHGLHVLAGLAMLSFALVVPRLEETDHTPHRSLHNASLYWHFVDVVWVFIVGLIYLLPRVQQ